MSNKHSILNRATKFLLPCMGVLVLLVGCDGGSNGALNGPQSDIYAANLDELPNCSANREGETATVESEKAIYQCVGGRWEYDSPLPESNSSAGKYGELLDTRDGQVYRTVKIGDQVWMAENLNIATEGSWCYDYTPANCETYGRLYTWYVAKTVCPAGWHLPSKEKFGMLLESVGSNAEERSVNLRSLSWANGQDKFGFSALPAGYYLISYAFCDLGRFAEFWSSTEYGENDAYRLGVGDGYAGVNSYYDMNDGRSVRCLKDN